MLLFICEISPYGYGHQHNGMGPHTGMVIFLDIISVSVNIGDVPICLVYTTGMFI